MAKENPNSHDRDHNEFPEVVADRDLYIAGKLWCAAGEVLSPEMVKFAHTREGRRAIGVELPNPVPLEPPIGYVAQVPLYEQMRAMVRRELSEAAQASGHETFEEADDFDVDDDFDPSSPFEEVFEPTKPWGQWSQELLDQELAGVTAVAAAREAANKEKEGGAGGRSPQAEGQSAKPAASQEAAASSAPASSRKAT